MVSLSSWRIYNLLFNKQVNRIWCRVAGFELKG